MWQRGRLDFCRMAPASCSLTVIGMKIGGRLYTPTNRKGLLLE